LAHFTDSASSDAFISVPSRMSRRTRSHFGVSLKFVATNLWPPLIGSLSKRAGSPGWEVATAGKAAHSATVTIAISEIAWL
jgi:hypothetical protein